MKILRYGLLSVLSAVALLAIAKENATTPLVFVEPLPTVPDEIAVGEVETIQYMIKNQGSTSSLPIYPSILNELGVPDDSIVARVGIGIGNDCGPAGSFLGPQDTCTLTYDITAPDDVGETIKQTLLIEYSARTGYELRSEIKFKIVSIFAYVVNDNGQTVSKCTIDSTGTFSACQNSGANLLIVPRGIAFSQATNGMTYAYITNTLAKVIQCDVVSGGLTDGDLGPCDDSTDLSANIMQGIAFHTADALYAYVVDSSIHRILKCEVNSATGVIDDSTCDTLTADNTLNFPEFITFKSFGVNTYAYIGNFLLPNDSVIKCTVDDSTGDFIAGSCAAATDEIDVATFQVALTRASGDDYAYVTTINNDVQKCLVSTVDGTLSDCVPTGSGFSAPRGIVTKTINDTQYMYVANNANQSVSRCIIGAFGALTNCVNMGFLGFSGPFGIAIQ